MRGPIFLMEFRNWTGEEAGLLSRTTGFAFLKSRKATYISVPSTAATSSRMASTAGALINFNAVVGPV